MTGNEFLARSIAQLMIEIAAQIDASAEKDKRIAELEARLAEDNSAKKDGSPA